MGFTRYADKVRARGHDTGLGVLIGVLCWVVGLVVFFGAEVSLHDQFRAIAPYDWKAETISELGRASCGDVNADANARCSPDHMVMSSTAFLNGLLLFAGLFATRRMWRQHRFGRWSVSLFVVYAIGWLAVAVFPIDTMHMLHMAAAAVMLTCAILGVAAAVPLIRMQLGKPLFWITAVVAGICVVAGITFVVTYPTFRLLGFVERIIAYGPQLWLIVVGVAWYGKLRSRIGSFAGSHIGQSQTTM